MGTGTAGFSYIASLIRLNTTAFTVRFQRNNQCEPELSGRSNCCNAPIKKVEFVLEPSCRGQIESISSPGPSTPKMPSYGTLAYPGTVPPLMANYPKPLTGKVTNLFSSTGQTTEFTVYLRKTGACPSVDSFLYNANFWYAAFGDTIKVDACCGQSSV